MSKGTFAIDLLKIISIPTFLCGVLFLIQYQNATPVCDTVEVPKGYACVPCTSHGGFTSPKVILKAKFDRQLPFDVVCNDAFGQEQASSPARPAPAP
ncbi:MAG: hypothetical protein KDJ15_01240 [Alphaproteobacteria bacterium]|nr:hypothetical protein [Alphaproteobacteria bacterium]